MLSLPPSDQVEWDASHSGSSNGHGDLDALCNGDESFKSKCFIPGCHGIFLFIYRNCGPRPS